MLSSTKWHNASDVFRNINVTGSYSPILSSVNIGADNWHEKMKKLLMFIEPIIVSLPTVYRKARITLASQKTNAI